MDEFEQKIVRRGRKYYVMYTNRHMRYWEDQHRFPRFSLSSARRLARKLKRKYE